MKGRQSRRPIPSSLDRGSGTWTEVLYWIWRRGRHYRRSATSAKDLQMVRIYRIHAEMCEAILYRLDHNLRFQSYMENGAHNITLSAHTTEFSNDQTPQ